MWSFRTKNSLMSPPEKSSGIEIQEFVNESEISGLYFEKPYYLEPDKGAGKAYALLREALTKTG